MEEKALTILIGIKDDVGKLRGEVGELRGVLTSRPCMLHQKELKDLHERIDGVDERVSKIKEKDLPAIRQSVSELSWWQKGRNKVIAAIMVAVMGALGTVVAEVVKDALSSQKAEAAEVTARDLAPAVPAIETLKE